MDDSFDQHDLVVLVDHGRDQHHQNHLVHLPHPVVLRVHLLVDHLEQWMMINDEDRLG